MKYKFDTDNFLKMALSLNLRNNIRLEPIDFVYNFIWGYLKDTPLEVADLECIDIKDGKIVFTEYSSPFELSVIRKTNDWSDDNFGIPGLEKEECLKLINEAIAYTQNIFDENNIELKNDD